MQETNKILQGLGIPHSALLSIIFGMMVLSFPLGAYVFFNSDAGAEITHQYPLEYLVTPFESFLQLLPFQLSLGDVFVVIWAVFVILFSIGIFGPKDNFVKTLTQILIFGKDDSSNYIVSMLKWFSILVFLSAVIDFLQNSIGIGIEPPAFDNDLVRFFSASLAPLIEEFAFRVLLIGLPLYALFYRRTTLQSFFTSLWHPFSNLDIPSESRVFTLIISVGILFGLAHVFFGESWSIGKFTQSAAGGIILGWVYYRYGLVAAILLHWATNYFIFSYVYFIANLVDISVTDAFVHPLLGSIELLFFVSGIISTAFLLTSFYILKQKQHLVR